MRTLCLALCLMSVLLLPAAPALAAHGDRDGHNQRTGPPRSSRYLENWLNALSPTQRVKALTVLDDARPGITDLRRKIQDKKVQLQNLSYDRDTSPDTLSRLGRDLQILRDELRAAFSSLDERMRNEVGEALSPPKSRGCAMGHQGPPEDAASR